MLNLEQIKITRRDQEVLKLLVQGCSNKEIAAELHIRPWHRVKQHLRTSFCGPELNRDASASFWQPPFSKRSKEAMSPHDQLSYREIQVATMVWEGKTNPEIAAVLGSTEQVVKTSCAESSTNWGLEPA